MCKKLQNVQNIWPRIRGGVFILNCISLQPGEGPAKRASIGVYVPVFAIFFFTVVFPVFIMVVIISLIIFFPPLPYHLLDSSYWTESRLYVNMVTLPLKNMEKSKALSTLYNFLPDK